MITVYGGWPTRSFRVLWALEELGLPYELHAVDLRKRNEDPELLARNPSGFLPAMQDGEVVMVESIAMLEYLIARYDSGGVLAPAPADPAFPAYLQFLHLGEAGLASFMNILVASRFAPEGERRNFGAQAAQNMFMNRLALVSRRLAEADYLAGDRFTAADISVAYALDLAERLGLGDRYGPELQAYRQRLAARPAHAAADAKSPAWASLPGA